MIMENIYQIVSIVKMFALPRRQKLSIAFSWFDGRPPFERGKVCP